MPDETNQSLASECEQTLQNDLSDQLFFELFKLILGWMRVITSRQMYRKLDVEQIAIDVLFELSLFVGKRELNVDVPTIESVFGICRSIAKRRVIDAVHAENCKKRAGGKQDLGADALSLCESKSIELENASNLAEFHELYSSLSEVLSPKSLRIVELRFENWSTKEIAKELGTTTRSVNRMRGVIQETVREFLKRTEVFDNRQQTTDAGRHVEKMSLSLTVEKFHFSCLESNCFPDLIM